VGFDLDLTLLDMRSATALALTSMNRTLSTNVDVPSVIHDLGAPFRTQLGRWIEEDSLDVALRTFAAAFLSEGMPLVKPLPGAREILEAVRRRGGRSVVITGRRTRIAKACLRHCDLTVDTVVGGLVGEAKSPAMREHRVDVYVGDHRVDMQGAREAGVTGVGVLGGTHTAAELTKAGATAVLNSLSELSEWLAPA
jgi:phosphoglycolate phosphatase-like HAD superfamily hydrolase